jgi:hypothetical protein
LGGQNVSADVKTSIGDAALPSGTMSPFIGAGEKLVAGMGAVLAAVVVAAAL